MYAHFLISFAINNAVHCPEVKLSHFEIKMAGLSLQCSAVLQDINSKGFTQVLEEL